MVGFGVDDSDSAVDFVGSMDVLSFGVGVDVSVDVLCVDIDAGVVEVSVDVLCVTVHVDLLPGNVDIVAGVVEVSVDVLCVTVHVDIVAGVVEVSVDVFRFTVVTVGVVWTLP